MFAILVPVVIAAGFVWPVSVTGLRSHTAVEGRFVHAGRRRVAHARSERPDRVVVLCCVIAYYTL